MKRKVTGHMPPPAYKSHFRNKVTHIQGWGSFIKLVLGPRAVRCLLWYKRRSWGGPPHAQRCPRGHSVCRVSSEASASTAADSEPCWVGPSGVASGPTPHALALFQNRAPLLPESHWGAPRPLISCFLSASDLLKPGGSCQAKASVFWSPPLPPFRVSAHRHTLPLCCTV